jgi:hypothetical protein
MEQNKIRHDPRHLVVPSGASKMIFETTVRSVQTIHLYCVKISTISKQTETSFHLCLITSEYHRVHPKQFLSLWYVWHNPCTYLAPTLTPSQNGLKHDSTSPKSPRVPSGASKMVSNTMVCSEQTVNLYCVKVSTISKQTKTSFQFCLIT